MARKDLTMEQIEFLDKCLKLLNSFEEKNKRNRIKAVSKYEGGVL